jgi:translation initiation factor eIF-2B subunit beta
VRKVLRLIREEYYAATAAGSSSAMASGSNTPQARTPLSLPMDISQGPKSPISIANFVVVGHPRHGHLSEKAERSSASGDIAELARRGATIKPVLIQAIQEVLDELETVYENVAKNARDHIHDE